MMTNRILKKQVTNLQKGTVIQGKWHKKRYEIKGKLGEGAIGSVYLCQVNQRLAALKISEKQTSIMLEVNVLKALEQVRGAYLGPALFDVDDWEQPDGAVCSFYVMEYIEGESLERFIRGKGAAWIGPLMFHLLEDLEKLHNEGWVFGDLKADNLIVRASSSPVKARWVDVGGTTQIGRSIKEYTELYDRGYWGLGSRRAEPSYDLFSLAIVFLQIYHPNRLRRSNKTGAKTLIAKINQTKQLSPYADVLKNAILGRYHTSAEMKRELKQVLLKTQRKARRKQPRQTDDFSLIKEAGWISLLSIFYFAASLFFG